MRFEGKTAVIVGGAGGIGLPTAARFLAEGARVILSDVDEDRLREGAHLLGGVSKSLSWLVTDVQNTQNIANLVAHITSLSGGADILVYAAMPDARVNREDKEWLHIHDVIVGGSRRCVEAVLPGMIECGNGRIVLLSSINGARAVQKGLVAYSCAKAALEQYACMLTIEHARNGIRANVVRLGTVHTGIWDKVIEEQPDMLEKLAAKYPAGRIVTLEEAVGPILFLASDDASGCFGAVLDVDVGHSACNPLVDFEEGV